MVQPYAAKIVAYLKAKHPAVPVVYFANGGSCFLHQQLDMGVDALSVDWRISMAHARSIAGRDAVLAGNVDPMVLYGSEKSIESAVLACAKQAGLGGKHVLNLGHGVEQDTPESAVQCFVDAARRLTAHPL
jgi:uroporphyrinogen-III decarboxylase